MRITSAAQQIHENLKVRKYTTVNYRQSTMDGRARCRCLPQWLLSATTTPSFDAISYNCCCRDSSPCVCSQSIGLLQRLTVWRVRQAYASTTVRPERCCPTCDRCERCDHITPILQQLHWLPVQQRVLFKIAVLIFQCLAGQAPSYLSDDCQPVSDPRPRRLRSSDSLTCVVRRAHNTYGDRCFATAGRGSGTFYRRFVTLCKIAPYRNSLTCLLTYSPSSWKVWLRSVQQFWRNG